MNQAALDQLSPDQLKQFATELMGQLTEHEKQAEQSKKQRLQQAQQLEKANKTLRQKDQHIEKLTYELAYLRRLKFARNSEKLSALQMSLLDDMTDADIAALESEIEQLTTDTEPSPAKPEKSQPKRQPLPDNLARTTVTHEPDNAQCSCGCQLHRIGEDVTEKLDYIPGTFQVERHVRGKWACKDCDTLTQAPMPPQIIDKGLPTAGLLAHLLLAKYVDHLPLYRQEKIFERAGVSLSRSTLAEWVGLCGVHLTPLAEALKSDLLGQDVLHVDETPVPMLKPGHGKTHQGYVWAYASTGFNDLNAVYYDFTLGRSGQYARDILHNWQGHLVCDDYSGYKKCFKQGMTEVACLAHARRKFVELVETGKSQIAYQAVELISGLYAIEQDVKTLDDQQRWHLRQSRGKPIADKLHQWLQANRQKVPHGSVTAKAIDYMLKRWVALTRYLDDGRLPIDNNWVENQMRPWALGRKNCWLFAGSERSGKRAAAIMTLVQSAKLNGHDPYAYLKDALIRLPTQKNSQIHELLPHHWSPLQS